MPSTYYRPIGPLLFAVSYGMITAPPLVLVVDDQRLVQMSLEEGLQVSGYNVIVASSGAEATRKIEEMGGKIQALVTNVHLGDGPNGWDVARRSREVEHTIPVIYTTASWNSDEASEAVQKSIVVSKPYSIARILDALSALMDTTVVPTHPAQSPLPPRIRDFEQRRKPNMLQSK